MVRVLRFFKIFTFITFVIAIAICYYEVTNDNRNIVLYTNALGRALYAVSPSEFFYAFGGFLLLFNILLGFVANLLRSYPLSQLPVPNKDFWLRDKSTRKNLVDVFETWVHSLAIILNIFAAILAAKIWLINRKQGGELQEYGYFVLGLLLLLCLWAGFIFYRLRLRREEFIT
jgi:hypothetical protein